jgi:hypothetical protein
VIQNGAVADEHDVRAIIAQALPAPAAHTVPPEPAMAAYRADPEVRLGEAQRRV